MDGQVEQRMSYLNCSMPVSPSAQTPSCNFMVPALSIDGGDSTQVIFSTRNRGCSFLCLGPIELLWQQQQRRVKTVEIAPNFISQKAFSMFLVSQWLKILFRRQVTSWTAGFTKVSHLVSLRLRWHSSATSFTHTCTCRLPNLPGQMKSSSQGLPGDVPPLTTRRYLNRNYPLDCLLQWGLQTISPWKKKTGQNVIVFTSLYSTEARGNKLQLRWYKKEHGVSAKENPGEDEE